MVAAIGLELVDTVFEFTDSVGCSLETLFLHRNCLSEIIGGVGLAAGFLFDQLFRLPVPRVAEAVRTRSKSPFRSWRSSGDMTASLCAPGGLLS